MPELEPDTITAWEADTITFRAAARLYRHVRARRHGEKVYSTASLSASFGMTATAIDGAKQVLASHGIIVKGPGGRWYVT
jgi:hypothetical protein